MPKLSVWMVRASLLYMACGFLFGSLILHHKGIPIYVWTWRLLPPHIEMMIFGWTIQFVIGMGYWVLPRFSTGDRYGRSWLGWWVFGFLNAGILLSAYAGWARSSEWVLVGRIGILVAVILFVIMVWNRVKPIAIGLPAEKTQDGSASGAPAQ